MSTIHQNLLFLLLGMVISNFITMLPFLRFRLVQFIIILIFSSLSYPVSVLNYEYQFLPFWLTMIVLYIRFSFTYILFLSTKHILVEDQKFEIKYSILYIIKILSTCYFISDYLFYNRPIRLHEIDKIISFVMMLSINYFFIFNSIKTVKKIFKSEYNKKRKETQYKIYKFVFVIGCIYTIFIFIVLYNFIFNKQILINLSLYSWICIFGLTLIIFPFFLINFIRELTYEEKYLSKTAYNIEENLEAKLKDFITSNKVYLNEKITLQNLSKLMKIQDYKIRHLVFHNLGFKHFNDFINKFRIEEACNILEKFSTTEEEPTMLRVGLDVGFNSLSTFYRAFSKEKGTSPKKYWENLKLGKNNPQSKSHVG